MKKRIVACACAATMLIGVLAGCGNNTRKTISEGEDITLRFSFWEASTGKEAETAFQNVVDSYEAEHPNVHIELVSQANAGYQDWIKAQTATDSLPEIQMNTAGNLVSMGKKGLVEDITDAYNMPNPYYDGKIWKDTFADGSLDGIHEYTTVPAYNIPLFATGVAMYYNKDIYNQLGLNVPNNWNEFIDNCKIIEEAGITPIAFMGQKNDQISILFYELSGDLYIDRWLDMENLNYNMDSHITQYEMAKAVDTGDFNLATDKALQADFEKLIEYIQKHVQYAPNGAGYDEAAAKMLFLTGKAAHLNSGSWDIAGLLANDENMVDVGVFKYPRLTEENDGYVGGPGISNNCYQSIAISSTVNKQEGAREAAIDFLMYLTSPEQYKIYIEGTRNIPSIKGVEVSDEYEAFLEPGGYPLIQSFRFGSSKVGTNPWEIIKKAAYGEEIELNDALFADMQKSIEKNMSDFIESKGLSPENNYKLDEMPIVGHVRK